MLGQERALSARNFEVWLPFYFMSSLSFLPASDTFTFALNHHVSNGEARIHREEEEIRGEGGLLRIPKNLGDPTTVRG